MTNAYALKPLENNAMKNYIFTMFYVVKTFVCFAGALVAIALNIDAGTLIAVGLLSLAAIPLFAYFGE
jgi:hypothetical protein